MTLIDQFEFGHNRGSSHGASRIFRFVYEQPFYVRMAQMALPLWRELETSTGRELLHITGGIDAGSEPQLSAIASALETCGVHFELLDPRSRSDRFPQFNLDDEFALYSPDSGALAAGDAVFALIDAARAAGAEVRQSLPVSKVVPNDDGVFLETPGGSLSARRCVLSGGGWNGPLASMAGIDLPLEVSCEQALYFDGVDFPVFIHRNGISYYAVPRIGDAPGVKVGEHATGRHTTADARQFEMDDAGAARVIDFVAKRMPGLDPEPVFGETCLYTLTPDEHFILDKSGPLVIASACSGHGFKFGPLLGEIVADLVAGDAPRVPLDQFSMDRFGQ